MYRYTVMNKMVIWVRLNVIRSVSAHGDAVGRGVDSCGRNDARTFLFIEVFEAFLVVEK